MFAPFNLLFSGNFETMPLHANETASGNIAVVAESEIVTASVSLEKRQPNVIDIIRRAHDSRCYLEHSTPDNPCVHGSRERTRSLALCWTASWGLRGGCTVSMYSSENLSTGLCRDRALARACNSYFMACR